jgi:hypothetical protein
MQSSALATPQRDPRERVDITVPDGRRLTISRKLKIALDLMVWEGNTFQDAANTASFNLFAMRKALERPHVRQYLKEQRQVFRASLSSGNEYHAARIRAQTDNHTAAIQAIRILDDMEEQSERHNAVRSPGVVIQIVTANVEQPLNSARVTINQPAIEPKGTPFDGERSGE